MSKPVVSPVWIELTISHSEEQIHVAGRTSNGEWLPSRPIGVTLSQFQAFTIAIEKAASARRALSNKVLEDGRLFHRAIFTGDIAEACGKLRNEAGGQLLVRLMVGDAVVQGTPIEAIREDGGYWGTSDRDYPVRGVPGGGSWKPRDVQGALRILAISPTGSAGLDNIKHSLTPLIKTGHVEWLDPVIGADARVPGIFDRLRGEPVPHILHFLGHGGINAAGKPVLRMGDDSDDEERWLDVEVLAQQLAANFRGELRLIVLEACEGARSSALACAAETLGKKGADAVIAHLWPVRANVAQTCSTQFYRALTESKHGAGDVAFATNEARRAMLATYDSSAEALSPVLYLRGTNAKIFELGHRVLDEHRERATGEIKEPENESPTIAGRRAVELPIASPVNVIGSAAIRSALQRWRSVHPAFSLTALALVPLLLVTWIVLGAVKNNSFTSVTQKASNEAASIRWSETLDSTKLDKLDALASRLDEIRAYRKNRSWLHYPFEGTSADVLEDGLVKYRAILQQILVQPFKTRLEERLGAVTGTHYAKEFADLKAYLLLGDANEAHLSDNAAVPWLASQLLDVTDDKSLRRRLKPHANRWVTMRRDNETEGMALAIPILERSREILARVAATQRLYDHFVTALEYQKHDEEESNEFYNLEYPPITLGDVFGDRPEVLNMIRSSRKERAGTWQQVRGPYTAKGHAQVLDSLERGAKLLESDGWVVPSTQEEERQGDTIQQSLARVRQDYEAQYVREWLEFFRDIQVVTPRNDKEAIEQFRVLSTPDWPYLRLLRVLRENSSFDETSAPNAGTSSGVKKEPIADYFRSMVRFGIPERGNDSPAPLAQYVAEMVKHMTELAALQDRHPSPGDKAKMTAATETTLKQTRALLVSMDETGQELLGPLLFAPFKGFGQTNR